MNAEIFNKGGFKFYYNYNVRHSVYAITRKVLVK